MPSRHRMKRQPPYAMVPAKTPPFYVFWWKLRMWNIHHSAVGELTACSALARIRAAQCLHQ